MQHILQIIVNNNKKYRNLLSKRKDQDTSCLFHKKFKFKIFKAHSKNRQQW
jgi:hypothetical protein